MNIAFPIDADDGLNRKISADFGKVMEYMVVNLENKTFEVKKYKISFDRKNLSGI